MGDCTGDTRSEGACGARMRGNRLVRIALVVALALLTFALNAELVEGRRRSLSP